MLALSEQATTLVGSNIASDNDMWGLEPMLLKVLTIANAINDRKDARS